MIFPHQKNFYMCAMPIKKINQLIYLYLYTWNNKGRINFCDLIFHSNLYNVWFAICYWLDNKIRHDLLVCVSARFSWKTIKLKSALLVAYFWKKSHTKVARLSLIFLELKRKFMYNKIRWANLYFLWLKQIIPLQLNSHDQVNIIWTLLQKIQKQLKKLNNAVSILSRKQNLYAPQPYGCL